MRDDLEDGEGEARDVFVRMKKRKDESQQLRYVGMMKATTVARLTAAEHATLPEKVRMCFSSLFVELKRL